MTPEEERDLRCRHVETKKLISLVIEMRKLQKERSKKAQELEIKVDNQIKEIE